MDDKEFLENTKQSISIEQMELLLTELGAEPQRQGEILTCRTICHDGDSHKLYYYENTHLFRCFTECSEVFDIFGLITKIKQRENEKWNLPQSLNFIIHYFNLAPKNKDDFQENEELLEDWEIFKKYARIKRIKEDKQIVDLKHYDDKVLKFLPRPRLPMWEKENITREVMNARGICYDPSARGIVIPHYDKDNNLIGIRERTLIKENETNGKYKPAILNRKMYNHPLGFSLYNLNNSKDNIKIMKKAIIFEGEKSCMIYASYFGLENDISVATCGSNLTTYQCQLLLDLGVEEIIIAFDKQFQEIGDKEWIGWTNKLKNIHKKYSREVKVSFMFDKTDLLGYKDSPIDCGQETFLKLFKERVSL